MEIYELIKTIVNFLAFGAVFALTTTAFVFFVSAAVITLFGDLGR